MALSIGHKGMREIQSLARNKLLPTNIANVDIPKCQACEYGKAKLRPSGTSPLVDPNKPIKPGELIHVDQAISRTPGRCILQSGKPTKSKWKVVTIFKDHASKKIFAEFQESTDANETIQSKRRIEQNRNNTE